MFSDKFIFEPCRRIKRSFYRCDSKFYLDEILEMYDDHETDGVVYTDGKTCSYYELTNNDLKKIDTSSIHLQGQFKAGGQSQNRLRRNREITRDFYIGNIAEKTVEVFYDKRKNCSKVRNLVFCGPAHFKTEVAEHREIKRFFDQSYTHILNMGILDYDILLEAVNNFDNPEEKETIGIIRDMIGTADDKLVFGDDILKLLSECQLATVYVHTSKIKEFRDLELSYEPTIIELSSNMTIGYGG